MWLWCIALPNFAQSAPKYRYGSVYATLVRVIDGDTIVVDIPEYPAIIGKNISVRVYGCDTPELRDKRPHIRKKAQEAKRFVQTFLQKAHNGNILLQNIGRDKYFRLVAEVIVPQTKQQPKGVANAQNADPQSLNAAFSSARYTLQNRSLAKALLEEKLALPYFGDTKSDFATLYGQ